MDSMAKNKILILIDQMEMGGAGRVISTLLPGLLEKEYEVTLVLDNINARVFYPIPNKVKQVYIPIKERKKTGIKQISLILYARKIIKQESPDIIIAVTFFPFFYAYYATLGMRIPIISYDHTSFGRTMGKFVDWIRHDLYRKADKLLILTEKDSRLIGKRFSNKEVIYNPLTYPITRHKCLRNKTVLCAGRIDCWEVKGFDRMIDIWSRIAPKYRDWKLQIAGGGSQSKIEELKAMVKQTGLETQVEFLGQIFDMPALYSETSIFALPSRVEGFPMVLMEAMSQGCVCCSFEMGGAVHEMMSSTSGSVVRDGDITEFEKQIEYLINLYPNYDSLRESGYTDVSRFSCEEFYMRWDNIIKEVIKK